MNPSLSRRSRLRTTIARQLATALLACMASACATTATNAGSGDGNEVATFVVVRHAEKSNDDPRDPSLDDAGHARAATLAERLAGHEVVAAYATAYRRTRQTVEPTAAVHGIAFQTYDAAQAADAFAAQLVAAHRRGTVLIAGHSNTVPQIVAALCRCPAAPMPETEFDRISTIRIDASGRRELEVERYSGNQATTGH